MHEDEFSSKPLLLHRLVCTKTRSIQNSEIPQTPSRAPVPIFFRIHAFYLWCPLSFPSTGKWVGGCDPVSLQWQCLNLSISTNLRWCSPWICPSQECAHPSEWCMCSGSRDFKVCRCVSSARTWETFLMSIPPYWPQPCCDWGVKNPKWFH